MPPIDRRLWDELSKAADLISSFEMPPIDRRLWDGVGQPHPIAQAGTMSGVSQAAQSSGGGDTTVSIGQITVQTQATDARGIASGLKSEIVRQFDAGIR